MMNTFWHKQKDAHPSGMVVLAPMADVTDNPFRRILSEVGPPDVYWNEFVSADGLSHEIARPKLEPMLSFEEDQRPIIAQIFSGDADNCYKAAEICAQHGFDGIDINMGCPVRNIIKQVSGSELTKIEHRDRVKNIIQQTRIGAGEVPVSVKTRLGFNEIDLSWVEFLLEHNLPCLTLHLRTRKEMSKVPAHWELIDQIIEMKNRIAPETVLIANGDINNRRDALIKTEQHPGLDGVMIGRGVLQNPWAFAENCLDEFSKEERIKLALRHTQYFLDEYTIDALSRNDSSVRPGTVDGQLTKNFNLMKKFYKCYINGFSRAKELRAELMACTQYDEIKLVCNRFLESVE